MDEALATVVQESIDKQVYPPTHQYDVATLTPLGVLAQRLVLITDLCSTFFYAKRFLDVGASKGFFSLRAAQYCDNVLAIDPDVGVLKLWAGVCPDNVEQRCCTFGELDPGEVGTFDMVWMGNGHHYAQLETRDYRWVEQLAWLASDRVVVEGALGPATSGFEDWAPGAVPEEHEWLAAAAAAGLHLRASCSSPTYTPGRAIWYLRRMH